MEEKSITKKCENQLKNMEKAYHRLANKQPLKSLSQTLQEHEKKTVFLILASYWFKCPECYGYFDVNVKM